MTDPDDGREPLDLATEALTQALSDAGLGPDGASAIDSIDVVNVVSWMYADLPGAIAKRVGASPSRTEHSTWGGNQPTLLLDRAAGRIAAGEHDVAVVVGAESFRSLQLTARQGRMPGWTPPPPDAVLPDPKEHLPATAWDHGLFSPVQVYPLYENGLRHRVGLDLDASQRWSAQLWARMSQIAADNPDAWDRTVRTVEEVVTPSADNRPISFPYTKLMNARITVDQAAAIVVTSIGAARRLGIDESRWVYPLGAAGADDPQDILARVSYHTAPAMRASLLGALDEVGRSAPEIDLLELYSCFPCVPKLALLELGLPLDRDITVAGGLTSFGGPGNDYMLHAVVSMARLLRERQGATGLLYGNGGFVTKHHTLVLGSDDTTEGYTTDGVGRDAALQARVDALPAPAVTATPSGRGRIETFTAPYDHAGEPERGIVIGRLDRTDERFVATVPRGQVGLLTDARHDPVGATGTVESTPDGNVFTIDERSPG
ncbi:MAG: acetyl-CoA acetyltransferase [Actinobacteria bacterium]|nr:acetyl-CoA acetyltransferase [Actinomycetota bacterium]